MKATVMSVLVGILKTVVKVLEKISEELEIRERIKTIQNSALLMIRIDKIFLETSDFSEETVKNLNEKLAKSENNLTRLYGFKYPYKILIIFKQNSLDLK